MVYIVESIGTNRETEQNILELARRDKMRVDDIVSLSQCGDDDSISVCRIQLNLSSFNSLKYISIISTHNTMIERLKWYFISDSCYLVGLDMNTNLLAALG
jgi:hypothetical protein